MDGCTAWVEATLADLDGERLVGQMVSIGFEGHEPSAQARRRLAEGRAGSVILSAHNIASPAQVAQLTAGLQAISPIALLFLIDQEGGIVSPYAPAALDAYQRGGILACTKHSPGKGESNLDSHLYLPKNHTRAGAWLAANWCPSSRPSTPSRAAR